MRDTLAAGPYTINAPPPYTPTEAPSTYSSNTNIHKSGWHKFNMRQNNILKAGLGLDS